MRRTPIIIIVTAVVVLCLLVRSLYTLLTLLVEDCSRDAIRHAEIPVPNSSLLNTRPQLIPKIIHQTYANASIPQHWQKPQKSCLALHEDYEYKVSEYVALIRSILYIMTSV